VGQTKPSNPENQKQMTVVIRMTSMTVETTCKHLEEKEEEAIEAQ
jgi:hypothetical protein